MQSSQQPSSSRHIYTITANQTSVQMVMIMHHNLYQRDTNFLCLFKTTHNLRPYRIVFSGLVCGLDEAPRAPPLLTLPRLLVSLPVQHHGYFSRLKFASHICPSHIRNPTFASDEVNRLYIFFFASFLRFRFFLSSLEAAKGTGRRRVGKPRRDKYAKRQLCYPDFIPFLILTSNP